MKGSDTSERTAMAKSREHECGAEMEELSPGDPREVDWWCPMCQEGLDDYEFKD